MQYTLVGDVVMRKSKKSRFTTSKLKNLKMDDDVYKLRRKVMDLIYEARTLAPDIPRITVRITEDAGKTLGVARMKGNIIWITKSAIRHPNLRTVVFHEICHGIGGIKHQKGGLMNPSLVNLTKYQAQKEFKYWSNKWRK